MIILASSLFPSKSSKCIAKPIRKKIDFVLFYFDFLFFS